MKIHSKIKEIALFSSCFFMIMLPPLLAPSVNPERFSKWTFPFQAIFLGLASLILLYIHSIINENQKINDKKLEIFQMENKLSKKNKTSAAFENLLKIGQIFLTFGILLICSICLQLIKLSFFQNEKTPSIFIKPPSSLWETIYFLLQFFCAAFFEEAIYRKFAPESLKQIAGKEKCFSVELIIALLFAFCHKYGGFFSILNAFTAHWILRNCTIKTGKLQCSTISHFFYNITTFFFMCQ